MSLGAVGRPHRDRGRYVRGSVRRATRTVPRRDLPQRSRHELRDVRHPLRPELRIERVVVCPSGVHVVTSLPTDFGDIGGEVAPPSMVSAGHMTADLVAAVLPERYHDRVRPVLCRVDDLAVAELVDDVLVTSSATLEHILGSSPAVLSTSEVHEVSRRLDARLEPFPLPSPPRRRRWRRRHTVVAALLAASSGAAAAAAAHQMGAIPLPW